MDSSTTQLDATALAQLVRDGEATPLELVDAAIARAEAINPTINAIIHPRFEKARAEATSDNLPDGPFRGVPIVLKDLGSPSAGDPFHLGIQALKDAGYVHPVDGFLVQRYREAGLIIIGRTNTSELGLAATSEPLAYGPSRNPWNLDHSTGGSSGGSAAAVAAGIVSVGHATDGGGSIRIPAAHCGLVGLKPSRGRTSNGPLADEWGISCQHVVSHTVRDTAALLDISAKPFASDGVMAPTTGQPYVDQVGRDLGKLRIGFMTHHVRVDVHPHCASLVEQTAALLESLGHHVEQANPAPLDDPEVKASYSGLVPAQTANTLDNLAAWIGRELTSDDVEPGTWALAQAGRSLSGPAVAAAYDGMHRFRRSMLEWWDTGFDILLTPTTASPPSPLGDMVPTDDDPMRGQMRSIPHAVFTSAFNITGQPGISLPIGNSDGLPLGVQLVASYGREDQLIALASQIETASPWADNRSPLHQ